MESFPLPNKMGLTKEDRGALHSSPLRRGSVALLMRWLVAESNLFRRMFRSKVISICEIRSLPHSSFTRRALRLVVFTSIRCFQFYLFPSTKTWTAQLGSTEQVLLSSFRKEIFFFERGGMKKRETSLPK